ncbi:metallophosphoesterase [Kitasatospora sp. MMS16-BH015]|uniref:metallophosphoesterase n=1 Tax=Kitasatospora sp. MMS16-BH015 TaxID=2018025 RepID=UPI0020C356BB|nr:metallophosphoesterase [Kitasatospora sp. MMS16-BH015]
MISDVHGHLADLLAGLRGHGLLDEGGHWSGGEARLWFLGDLTDRGPDGLGVIDLVRRLGTEAAADGGRCEVLLGNHEVLLLGARHFGDRPFQGRTGVATSFLGLWLRNGGRPSDLAGLDQDRIDWLSGLPAMAREGGHLLVHADSTAYLEYGRTVEAVNDAVRTVLAAADIHAWRDCFSRLTRRFAFRGEEGPQQVGEVLAVFGGDRLVHGHSPIPVLLDRFGPADLDGQREPELGGALVYAAGLALAVDGGRGTEDAEGRLLIVRLPEPV